MKWFSKNQNHKNASWGALIIGVIGVLIIALLWNPVRRLEKDLHQLQKTPTEEAKREFDASLEYFKALIGGLGTLATIVGGVFLYLNFRVATQNTRIANLNAKIANRNARIAERNAKNTERKLELDKAHADQNARLAESRLITERFSKAVEQLGSEKMNIRIGGIYALEQIAYDSDVYHWPVMEVLTTFIRGQSPIERESASSALESRPWFLQPITDDIQTALTVIGRRKVEQDPADENKVINLSWTKLFRANLSYSKLAQCNFSGSTMRDVNLSGATLTDANFLGSDLFQARLVGAQLQRVHLENANLCEADLEGAQLQSAFFSKHTNLAGANLLESSLEGSVGLEQEQWQEAKLCGTTMPDGTVCDRDCKELGLAEKR